MHAVTLLTSQMHKNLLESVKYEKWFLLTNTKAQHYFNADGLEVIPFC